MTFAQVRQPADLPADFRRSLLPLKCQTGAPLGSASACRNRRPIPSGITRGRCHSRFTRERTGESRRGVHGIGSTTCPTTAIGISMQAGEGAVSEPGGRGSHREASLSRLRDPLTGTGASTNDAGGASDASGANADDNKRLLPRHRPAWRA
jgi:hypothetical protein